MGQTSHDYRFFAIAPNNPDLPLLARKYKDLRLSALQLSPDSFSSTYASEAALSDEAWLNRLNAPGKILFVCSAKADKVTDEEWAAVVTLIGPVSAAAFTLPKESTVPPTKPDDIEGRWQLSSLYTLPAHRGQSLGRRLCEFGIDQLRSATQVRELRVRLMIKPTNTVVIDMYKNMGFEHSGKCTLEEALKANLELENLPDEVELGDVGEAAEKLRERFRTRLGLVMERIIRKQD